MFEYIIIGIVGSGLYLFFFYLRKIFFAQNRYYNLVIHCASLVFFGILFFGVFRESAGAVNVFTGLLIFLLLYFVFNIIRELVFVNARKKKDYLDP